jgi:betaine-aldehyde dehydrogenase
VALTGTKTFQNYIAGEWVDAASGETFESANPATGDTIGTFPRSSAEDVDRAVAAAKTAFEDWRLVPAPHRGEILYRFANLLMEEKDEFTDLMSHEMGKVKAEAGGDVQEAIDMSLYMAGEGRRLFGQTTPSELRDKFNMSVRMPIGVVGVITPWNFPLLIVSQKLPFALAVGCTAVVKPSDLTPGTTTRLVQILHDEGMPNGVVNLVHGGGDVGGWLSSHPRTHMTTFTGSTGVGRLVAAAAAKDLKKVSLELGGKNPQVIFPDADLDAALEKVVFGAYFNQGECCNAGSRLLVHADIADEFTQRVVQRAEDVAVGDPLDPVTKVGALISEKHLGVVSGYVDLGQTEGASVALGGSQLNSDRGRYYSPTVLAGVPKTARVAREEIFGPVLSVVRFADLAEAVEITNATGYGLSAGVWSRAIDTALGYARATKAGTVWINCYMDGFPEISFGGYGASGIGRELGRTAIDEYIEHKSTIIRTGAQAPSWVGGIGEK